LAFPLIAAAVGSLPFALVTAAFVVPVVYIVYLYDVDAWEDRPIPVILLAFGAGGVLALLFTTLWREVIFRDDFRVLTSAISGTVRLKDLMILCLLVPVVGEVLREAGPIALLRQRRFDDLLDGITFGVTSGVAFAAFETLVEYRAVIVNGPARSGHLNAALWVSIVLTQALIKPLVYGTATGLACAAFSGIGEGYDGFKPKYFAAFGQAIIANIAFQLGLYLFGLVEGTAGAVLGMLWGVVVAGVLLLRTRYTLHSALLEAALQSTRAGSATRHATRDSGYCSHCHMPLADGSLFCVSCGNSVRAQSKTVQTFNTSATVPQ
jgi:RsiW-degrading membrane proteinase PrsW (M82 family)